MNLTEPDYRSFDSLEYLRTYYSELDYWSFEFLSFFSNLRLMPEVQNARIHDFGAGPSLISVISLAERCSEIHVSDFLDCNITELKNWKRGDPTAWSWDLFTEKAISFERQVQADHSHPKPTESEVTERTALVRKKITRILKGDATLPQPLGREQIPPYDVVVASFCLSEIAADKAELDHVIKNVLTLLKPGGLFIFTTLLEGSDYRVGEKFFSALPITFDEVVSCLVRANAVRDSIKHKIVPALEEKDYGSFVMTAAIIGESNQDRVESL